MTHAQTLLEELKRETKATRVALKRVPLEKSDWKPHEKSMTLGRLAKHVAEIPSWFRHTLEQDGLDFSQPSGTPFTPEDSAALLAFFDNNCSDAADVLSQFPDERMQEMWTMRNGDMVFFTLPKSEVVRTWCLNHWYHHRAQLGVYLRLLDIPVPGTYGPSADL